MKQRLAVLTATLFVASSLLFYACEKDVKSSRQNAGNVSDGKVGVMSAPQATCGAGNTQISINLHVTGGSVTGAPAGFTVQWMTKDDFTANGNKWPSDDALNAPASFCEGSFSGNANLSRYNLNANQSVDINIGEFLFDNGASTSCPVALECGTTYVFRFFAHANSAYKRSDWSSVLECSTLPCNSSNGCTYSQGYWKTHGPVPTGNNANVWPDAVKNNGLTVGAVNYTADQLLSVLNTPPAGGNGLVILAHQLIAAKLNVANGSGTVINVTVGGTTYTDVNALIAAADALVGNKVIPPVGSGSLTADAVTGLVSALGNYNEGAAGPGHCE